MTVKDFALVVVRLFGLWVFYQCIGSTERMVASFVPIQTLGPDYSRFVLIANTFDLVLRVAIGAALTWKPQVVANRLPLSTGKETGLRLSAANLIFVCFSVAGLVFLVTGMTGLVYRAATWFFAPTGPFFEKGIDRAGIIAELFQAAIGLWLLCRFRGMVRGLRWLLKAGRTLGAPKTEEGQ